MDHHPTPAERFYQPDVTYEVYLDAVIPGFTQPVRGKITHHDPIRIHIDNEIEIPRNRIMLIARVEDTE